MKINQCKTDALSGKQVIYITHFKTKQMSLQTGSNKQHYLINKLSLIIMKNIPNSAVVPEIISFGPFPLALAAHTYDTEEL